MNSEHCASSVEIPGGLRFQTTAGGAWGAAGMLGVEGQEEEDQEVGKVARRADTKRYRDGF